MTRNNNNLESSRGFSSGGFKNSRVNNGKYFKSITSPMKHQSGESSPQRLSPSVREASPQFGSYTSSPRTSPGLLAGHYAGCKFTEPPLPSALPLPPKHWMQSSPVILRPFHKQEPEQLAHQLKVLLKLQA